VLLVVHRQLLSIAVSIARVVEVASFAAEEGRVDDEVVGQTEHVAVADAFVFVALLSVVGHSVVDDLSNVLDEDVVLLKIFESEQTDSVDLALADFELLRLKGALSIEHGQGQVTLVLFLVGAVLLAFNLRQDLVLSLLLHGLELVLYLVQLLLPASTLLLLLEEVGALLFFFSWAQFLLSEDLLNDNLPGLAEGCEDVSVSHVLATDLVH